MMAALSVTYLLSILLQNLLFCIPIVAVLHGKNRVVWEGKTTPFPQQNAPAAIIFQENYLYKTETVFYISL